MQKKNTSSSSFRVTSMRQGVQAPHRPAETARGDAQAKVLDVQLDENLGQLKCLVQEGRGAAREWISLERLPAKLLPAAETYRRSLETQLASAAQVVESLKRRKSVPASGSASVSPSPSTSVSASPIKNKRLAVPVAAPASPPKQTVVRIFPPRNAAVVKDGRSSGGDGEGSLIDVGAQDDFETQIPERTAPEDHAEEIESKRARLVETMRNARLSKAASGQSSCFLM